MFLFAQFELCISMYDICIMFTFAWFLQPDTVFQLKVAAYSDEG